MPNYYARRTGKYALPPNVRSQLIYLIKDYERMKEEADAILSEYRINFEDMPKQSAHSDMVASKAARREYILLRLEAIDTAFQKVPEVYRLPIYNNICRRARYPDYADKTTFWRWRSKMLYYLAKSLGMI